MATISQHAPDPQAFWDLVKERFVSATKTENKVSAFWFTTLFWDKYKMKPYWGEWEERLGAIASDLAADYQWLNKREKFHEQVFGDIQRWWRLIDIPTVVKEQGTDFTGKSSRGFDTTQGMSGKRIVGKNSPMESVDLPMNHYGVQDRANFLATELGIQGGVRVRDPNDPTGQKWITRPDFSNVATSSAGIDKGHSHLTRNIRTKQQPGQKISQIMRCFKMVEYNVNDIFLNYRHHFHGFGTPQIRMEIDPYTGFYNYKTRYEIEAELPDAVKKAKQVIEEGYKPVSFESWEKRFNNGEKVEEKWILENLKLFREFLEKQAKKSSGKNLEMIERNIGYCKALRMGFERPLTWPTIEEYDAVMAEIEGFEIFKSQLRMNFVNNRRAAEQGQMTEQQFLNLTGFPGTGKTLIAMTYARACQRPITVVGYASQNHPKVIEGISQSYQGAEISRTLASLVETSAQVSYKIEDLETELNYLKELPNVKKGNPTERQKYRMENMEPSTDPYDLASTCLAREIESMQKAGDKVRYEDRYSRAPILLLDEYEKCGDRPTKQAVGNISEEKSCENFFDKFFGFTVDIREMTVIITCNYEWAIEPFIKSRFDSILIDIPPYQQRIRTVWGFAERLVRKRFPASKAEGGKATDKANEKASLGKAPDEKVFTTKQKQVWNLFDEEFIKWTIDEGWGVREVGLIWNKKIMPTLYYFDSVHVDNDKTKNSLLTEILNDGRQKLSKMAWDKVGRFKANGDGVIVLKFFDAKETNAIKTLGEAPIMTWNYKRLTEPEKNPETGVSTGLIDSVFRIKGIVKNRDNTYDNWFGINNIDTSMTTPKDIYKKIIDEGVPKWWKIVDGEFWKAPTFKVEKATPTTTS